MELQWFVIKHEIVRVTMEFAFTNLGEQIKSPIVTPAMTAQKPGIHEAS